MSAAYLLVFMVLQYILVSDEIISFAERVSSAENFLQLFLVNGNCNLFNLIIIFFFFRDTQINQMGHLKMAGNLKNQAMNSDLILVIQKVRNGPSQYTFTEG